MGQQLVLDLGDDAGARPGARMLDHHVAAYLAEKKAEGLARATLAMYRGRLYHFVESMNGQPITRARVVRWVGSLDHLAANSRRFYWGIAHGYCEWLVKRGALKQDPFGDLKPPKTTRPVHRALDDAQVRILLEHADERTRAVMVLGFYAGLRRAEIAALEVGDVSIPSRTVTVRYGKGGHGRVVPLSPDAVWFLSAYIARHSLAEGPLIRSLARPQRGVTGATIAKVWRDVAYASGVKQRPRDGVATHSARHTCATGAYKASRDVVAVQGILGHSQLSTTARYVAGLDVEGLRPAVADLHWLAPRTRNGDAA